MEDPTPRCALLIMPDPRHHRAVDLLRYLRQAVVFALCWVAGNLCLAHVGYAEQAPGDGQRVLAIADIHGAYDELRDILRHVELVDKRGRWIGGDAILVQTGDFFDRGARTIDVARYLKKLQEQAEKKGGQVIILLGNHEVLNLIGDLRYVTRNILDAFVDARSADRHTFYCNDYSKYVRRQAVLKGEEPLDRREVLSKCQAQQTYGLVEYIEALSPEGELGAWLRTLPAAAQIDNVVFLHGGLSPALAGRSIDDINQQVALELATFDRVRQRLLEEKRILSTTHLQNILGAARTLKAEEEAAGRQPSEDVQRVLGLGDSLLLSSDGPLWFRGYAKWEDSEGDAAMPGILEPLSANHVVVGHTPQHTHRIMSRFDNQVFLIDTGMLREYYEGYASALEIRDGRFYSHYLGEPPKEVSGVEAAP